MDNPESIPTTQLHQHLGAHPVSDSRTRFCVWSPDHDVVTVNLPDQDRHVTMEKIGSYHVAEIEGVSSGDAYLYVFEQDLGSDSKGLPDPASRYQQDGVHGPSRVVSSEFPWSDADWRGIPRGDWVVYELHLGAFTAEGTFAAATDRLDELVDLGVTAIEMMPVADCAGRWNWGYDGVNLFAPNRNYGTPDDMRRLIDAAHQKGIAVFLDVVYNHLGPEGNYLGASGPYLSEHHSTVWGSAPNFDDPIHGRELRRFFIANAIHWFDEYHLDGLRVDAIHCMRDDSETHVVAEMSAAVKDWSRKSNRPAMLIAESNVYDPQMLTPLEDNGIGFDAEWCDDFLHSVFAVVRPGEQLCHRTYASGTDLDQTLKSGFIYEGTLHNERGRCPPGPRVDTRGLIYSIQHHDFIGNHPLGKRLHQLTSRETQRAAAALLLLSPAIPMLFMGEEFACEHPFRFFVDFGDEHLRQAVVDGRKREYPQHDWTAGVLPTDEQAFRSSKIGPAAAGDSGMRDWYRSLLRVRKQWKNMELLQDNCLTVQTDLTAGLFRIDYRLPDQSACVAVRLLAQATDNREPIELSDIGGALLLDSAEGCCEPRQLLPNQAKVFGNQP
ncbi:MAG: malto-oligosyltrehalose trehalohydrolase [Rubripirellula sp.]